MSTKAICRLYHTTEEKWLNDTLETLKKYTDREIRIRKKGDTTPLVEQLKNSWAMVTMQSATAAHRGSIKWCQYFKDEVSQANVINENDLSKIERPYITQIEIL